MSLFCEASVPTYQLAGEEWGVWWGGSGVQVVASRMYIGVIQNHRLPDTYDLLYNNYLFHPVPRIGHTDICRFNTIYIYYYYG